jgi:hypothetical protein
MANKKNRLLVRYNKEEKRHDVKYEKENTLHEKRHKVEIDQALKIGGKSKKKRK